MRSFEPIRRIVFCAMGAMGATVCGCQFTRSTTVHVRDATGVSLRIETRSGATELLGEGAVAHEATLPRASPPYWDAPSERFETTIRRELGGAIAIRCEGCEGSKRQSLLGDDGAITLGGALRETSVAWEAGRLRIDFVDVRMGDDASSATFEAALGTPAGNVIDVRRRYEPDRAFGVKLVIGGIASALLGGVALYDGLANHRDASNAASLGLGALALLLLGSGSWYTLAPAHDAILYDATTR